MRAEVCGYKDKVPTEAHLSQMKKRIGKAGFKAIERYLRGEANRDMAWQANAEACKHIAISSTDIAAHLIYVSTDYVFNGEKGLYREEDTPNPINYYGYTKLMGEAFVRQYAKSWCIARTSVIYGWGGTKLAQMLIEIAERRLKGILHTSGASRASRYEFAKKLADTFNLNPNVIAPAKMIELQWKARRPKDLSLDTTKCSSILKEAKPLARAEDALKAITLERDIKAKT
jgi:dTDP-4-dehydrorhamnose reductase